MIVLSVFGLSKDQLYKIQVGYDVGKTIIASDGMTFEKGLPSIGGKESSWGIYVIGDKYDNNGRLKSLYESSLGDYQIKLSTAKITIRKYPHLFKKYSHFLYEGDSIYLQYEKNLVLLRKYKKKANVDEKQFKKNALLELKNSEHAKKIKYYKSVLNNKIWKKRFEEKQERAIKTIAWAKRRLSYHTKFYNEELDNLMKNSRKEYLTLLKKIESLQKIHNSLVGKANKDTALINKLLTDTRFSAEIGGYYLLSIYEEALKRGYKGNDAYRRAVGRYNGGWNNKKYYYGFTRTRLKNGKLVSYHVDGVRDKILYINKLIKKGKIKT